MKKLLVSLSIVSSIFLQAQTQESSNIVKTSELELFLFKIGFQSLLNDFEITKNKTELNEEELKKLNQKIAIIMDEIYKNKRVLKTDSSSVIVKDNTNADEIVKLKEEIDLLKKQMHEIKNIKTNVSTLKPKKKEASKKVQKTQKVVKKETVKEKPKVVRKEVKQVNPISKKNKSSYKYALYLGAYKNKQNAIKVHKLIQSKYPKHNVKMEEKGSFNSIVIFDIESKEKVLALKNDLLNDFPGSFIRKFKTQQKP